MAALSHCGLCPNWAGVTLPPGGPAVVNDPIHAHSVPSWDRHKEDGRGSWSSTARGSCEHPELGSHSPMLAISSAAGPASSLRFSQFPPRYSGQQLEPCSWSGGKGQTTVRRHFIVFIRKRCVRPAVPEYGHPGLSISFQLPWLPWSLASRWLLTVPGR